VLVIGISKCFQLLPRWLTYCSLNASLSFSN
jgi:hypothetical protein